MEKKSQTHAWIRIWSYIIAVFFFKFLKKEKKNNNFNHHIETATYIH